jgi:hypothetical protein
MGSAASRASNPTHKTSAGPSGARSAPGITPISQSYVTANTSPANATCRSPLARPAPLPNRDVQPPPDPNSSPHAKVSPTDFHLPKVDADAGYPYGSQYRSPEDMKPIDTPGFTVTFPLRLP